MHLNQWTFLDYVFIVIVLVSIAFAVLKGLVREFVSLLSLIGGFILAAYYYPIPAKMLVDYCRTDSVAGFLGFSSIFLGCILLGALVAFTINRFVKASSLKWIDRLLGGIFGFLRGWAIASALVFGLIAFPVRENVVAASVLAPYLLAGARAAILMVPQELKNEFNKEYKRVLEAWNRNKGAA
jgi:membrane protein required for colicin V production